jgi:hypothetical protein
MKKPKFISIEGLFPDLFKIIPGWLRGTYYSVTGATGTGKSKFARFAFAAWTYKYCRANNIPFKVIYFALEESKEFFWTTMLLSILQQETGISLTYYQYKGFHEGMTPEIQSEIDKIMPQIDDMKLFIIVYDDIGNPTGILRTVEKEIAAHGEYIQGESFVDEQGNTVSLKKFKYHDPDFHVVVITDHVGLSEPEQNKFAPVNTLHLAISKLSEYVVKIFCKRLNCIFVSVHQQEMAGENNDNFKLNRLEPSEAKLGDNKLVGRDYMVSLGIFNPAKYSIKSYLGYNVSSFGDHFRTLHVLKHRNGLANIAKAMWFDGVGNSFEELPSPDKKEEIEQFLKNKENGTR